MTEWFTSGLSEWLANMWVSHYDPFYWWCFLGALVIIFSTWLAWFFDILRPLAGAISLAVIAALAGFRKGQYVEQDRQKARDRSREPEDENGGNRWPW